MIPRLQIDDTLHLQPNQGFLRTELNIERKQARLRRPRLHLDHRRRILLTDLIDRPHKLPPLALNARIRHIFHLRRIMQIQLHLDIPQSRILNLRLLIPLRLQRQYRRPPTSFAHPHIQQERQGGLIRHLILILHSLHPALRREPLSRIARAQRPRLIPFLFIEIRRDPELQLLAERIR